MGETPATPTTLTERLTAKMSAYVALSTAILAAITAIAALLMTRHSGRATSELVKASNSWNYYQAKSLKSYILTSEKTILTGMDKSPDPKAEAKLAELEEEKKTIKAEAEAHTTASEQNSKLSRLLGDAVTLLQIAIANSAIAALSKKLGFWMVGLGFGLIGIGFLAYYFTLG
jgi:hypothetical protein